MQLSKLEVNTLLELLGSEAIDPTTHPVRGVILGSALSLSLWVTLPSFFGRRVKGTNWELSHTVERVDWFVSHAWIDSGKDKVQILRELCFLQQFVARTLVVADTSGLHCRGLAAPGLSRRALRPMGADNDGGVKRGNPFRRS